MNTIPVTVVIPVKNEEAGIGRCLSRLKGFAQVIVIDSGSTDRTCEIAREHGASVLDFRWDGKYPKKRNWFLLNHKPACDWVLFLDADELVDAEFCLQLEAALAKGGHAAYWLNYTNYFLGKKLNHGVAQRKLALFRFGSGLYERIEENGWSRLDMEIHEHPVIKGSIGEIAAPIEHNDDKGIAKFVERHREYALWEAARLLELRQGGLQTALTPRQRFKYRHLAKWWYPWFYFTLQYFGKFGFLDGAAGFNHAFYKAWYFQTIRLLVLEAARTQPSMKKDTLDA